MRRRAAAVVLALAAVFVAAPAALAENGTAQQGYGGVPVVQVPLEESAQESAEESAVAESPAEEQSASPAEEQSASPAEEQSASPEKAFRPPVAKSAGTQATSTTTARPVSAQAEAATTLPVTGAELAFVFVAGALLVLVGFGMNRLARPRRTVR